MDFGAFPPEVNSGRMYSGAGPGPLLAAASAWAELADELQSAAAGYAAVVSDLAGDWHGPSAAAMSVAAAPYVEWISGLAGQAEQTGAQASAAAAAYEAAFAATVPPPVIAANRSLLATLIATNILGLNATAIAATEAHYGQMWAQDAAAMYGYAGSAAAATQLSPFASPPQTTTRDGAAAQAASAAASSPIVSDGSSVIGSISTILGNLTGAYSPLGWAGNAGTGWLSSMQILALAQNVPGVVSLLNGPAPISGALGPLSGGYISWQAPMSGSAGVGSVTVSSVSAASGRANLVGPLSVPRSWASIAPAVNTVPASLSSSSVAASAQAITLEGASPMFSEMALSSLAGRAVGGTAVRTVAGTSARVIDKAADTEALTTATILVIPVSEE